jgi:N-ethylmaleimide reductase
MTDKERIMIQQELLWQPFQLSKNLQLKNRIIMAPMTRSMATDNLLPTKAMVDYYVRRAEAGLIITEGTIIRPDGLGYKNTPGIYTEDQIAAWQQVTKAVHQHNGHIFMQIWHVGRVSHPSLLKGKLPISASETMMKESVKREKGLEYGKSRAVSLAEIKILIDDYANAAKNAIRAGFDGVEIHGANGYLIDQFLHHHTNLRKDSYGATPANMAKFALEIVEACGEAIGYSKVGIRLSPGAYLNEITGHPKDAEVFQHLLKQLNGLPIAYIHTGNFDDKVKFPELANKTMTDFIRSHYYGTLIGCGSYSFAEAVADIALNKFDLIAMGRPFIANPDLIQRLKNNQALQPYAAAMLMALY